MSDFSANLYDEDYLVEGISDLGLDVLKSSSILTEDSKYSIFYDDFTLYIIDNQNKELISKNTFTKKLRNIKTYPDNFISYILDDKDGSTLITSHIESIEDNLEMRRPFFILDYLIFNFLAPFEFFLYMNNIGDIHICRNDEIISQTSNVIKDMKFYERNVNFDLRDISKIYFSEETQNLLIFFTQGKILYYYLSLKISEIQSSEIILSKRGLLNIYEDKNVDYHSNKAQNIINSVDIVSVRTITFDDQNQYLIIGFNDEILNSKIKIFEFIKNDDNENASIKYDLMPVRNDEANDNKQLLWIEKYKNSFLIDLILFNSNSPLGLAGSDKNPNSIIFLMKEKNTNKYSIQIEKLEYYINEESNSVHYEWEYNIALRNIFLKNIYILGLYYCDSKHCYELSLRFLIAKNKNELLVSDEGITCVEKSVVIIPELKFEKSSKIKNLLNNLKIKEKDNLSIEIVTDIFCYINNLLRTEFFFEMPLPSGLTNVEKNFDWYLSYLIISLDFISVKNYLSILSDKIDNYPYVSNEMLFKTIEILLTLFVSQFTEKIKENILDENFFSNSKLVNIFKIFNKLLYINKARSEEPIFRPFVAEKEILLENSIKICKLIEKSENLILITKVFKHYIYFYSNKNSNVDYNSLACKYFNMFISLFFSETTKAQFPEIKLYYLKYLESILNNNYDDKLSSVQIKDINKDLEESIYSSKLILFLIYSYYVILEEIIKIVLPKNDNYNNNKNILPVGISIDIYNKESQFFQIIKDQFLLKNSSDFSEEFDNYFELAYQIFLLDNFDHMKQKYSTYELKINTSAISNFVYFYNNESLPFSIIYKNKNTFNAQFLKQLNDNQRYKDGLIIFKNIIPFYDTYEELSNQLTIFLNLDIINLAFQFVNNCFACKINLNEISGSTGNSHKKNIIENFQKDQDCRLITALYCEFYKHLINNKKIEYLLNLPLNSVERYILKDLILSDKKLENLLVLFYMKMKNPKNSEFSIDNLMQSENINLSKPYTLMLEAMGYIFGTADSDIINKNKKNSYQNKNCEMNKNSQRLSIGFKHNFGVIYSNNLLHNYSLNLNNNNSMDIEQENKKMSIHQINPKEKLGIKI